MIRPNERMMRFLTVEMHPTDRLTKHAFFPMILRWAFFIGKIMFCEIVCGMHFDRQKTRHP